MSEESNKVAELERARAEEAELIRKLRGRLTFIEGFLVYARNFLPEPLKKQADVILFPNGEDTSL